MKPTLKLLICFILVILSSDQINAQSKFSTDSLIIYMKKVGVKHIVIALKQAKLETGYFTSDRFINDRNLFGMQKAKNRKTTAIGQRDGYAVYESWKQSVVDYYLWQNDFYRLTGKENYSRLLVSRKYNLNKNYMKTVLAVHITQHEMDLINEK